MSRGSEGKHDLLVKLCRDILNSQGLSVRTHVEYGKGELDVLCNGIYYEIKCNRTAKNVRNSIDQIYRAISNGMANHGYLITYQGLEDVLPEESDFNPNSKNDLFNHTYNPLHFYCRLIDIGVPDKKAKELTINYEKIYKDAINSKYPTD